MTARTVLPIELKVCVSLRPTTCASYASPNLCSNFQVTSTRAPSNWFVLLFLLEAPLCLCLERLLRALRSIPRKTSSSLPGKTGASEAGLYALVSGFLPTPSTPGQSPHCGTRLRRSKQGSSTSSSTNLSQRCKSRWTRLVHACGPPAAATSIARHSGVSMSLFDEVGSGPPLSGDSLVGPIGTRSPSARQH